MPIRQNMTGNQHKIGRFNRRNAPKALKNCVLTTMTGEVIKQYRGYVNCNSITNLSQVTVGRAVGKSTALHGFYSTLSGTLPRRFP